MRSSWRKLKRHHKNVRVYRPSSSLPSLAPSSSIRRQSMIAQGEANNSRYFVTSTGLTNRYLLENPSSSSSSLVSLSPSKCSFSSSSSEVSQGDDTNVENPKNPFERAVAELPDGAQIHLDFFGEPVTFFGCTNKTTTTTTATATKRSDDISAAVASLDGFIIGIASKGKAFTGGGEEEGINIQSAHSTALAWSDLLRYASAWNQNNIDTMERTKGKAIFTEKAAPMLAYVAVAPLFAQTGVAYVKYIDHLLSQVESGVEDLPSIQLMELANQAISMKDNEYINSRERTHLLALECMVRQDHKRALVILVRHLQICPGDALALSIALDLAHTVGDTRSALSAAGSVAAYWNERRGGFITPSIPGYNTASALIALGLAVGGRRQEAEQLATYAMEKGEKLAGGVATWAMAHVLDAEGRTAEGISACANTDGTRNFEECGLLFFDSIVNGYGVRFALDREERGRGRSAGLRLYDNNYERILEDRGFSQGILWDAPTRKSPLGWSRSGFEKKKKKKATETSGPKSFIGDLFGKPEEDANATQNSSSKNYDDENNDKDVVTNDGGEVVTGEKSLPSLQRENWVPSCEDILTWMPPTPQLLADATLLLLRLTLNGTISSQNYRWDNLRNAWTVLLDIQKLYGDGGRNGTNDDGQEKLGKLNFYPLACVAASLVASPSQVGELSGPAGRLARGLHKMGELLDLGAVSSNVADDDDDEDNDDAEKEDENNLSTFLFRDIVADKQPDFWLPSDDVAKRDEWRITLNLLSSAIDGVYDPSDMKHFNILQAEISSNFEAWEFDVRPFLEHAVVYAACKCGDDESLSLARSICSRGVTLRPNSPEEWWRYSIVLGLLGDEVASEDALATSLAFGGGQGARRDH